MNGIASVARACGALLALCVGAALDAQATPTPPGGRSQLFLDGWMAELLHGNGEAARASYKEAIEKTDLPDFQSELAALRLWESTWRLDERQRFRLNLEARGVYPRLTVRVTRSMDRLQRRFESAVQKNDQDELVLLRRELVELVARNAGAANPRPLVAAQLPVFRDVPARTDPELEDLKRRRQEALARRDIPTAGQLWYQIQTRLNSAERSASQRVQAKRWAEMTRLHLAGEHRQASNMEEMLRGKGTEPDRFGKRRRPATSTAAHWLAEIRGDAQARQEMLVAVRERLGRLIERRSVIAEERTVLEALQKRLAELAAADSIDPALVLAAQVPYRNELFR